MYSLLSPRVIRISPQEWEECVLILQISCWTVYLWVLLQLEFSYPIHVCMSVCMCVSVYEMGIEIKQVSLSLPLSIKKVQTNYCQPVIGHVL